MLVAVVCLALLSLLIYLIFTYKQPTELDDVVENRAVLELRRRRQTIASREGIDIDSASPNQEQIILDREHWEIDSRGSNNQNQIKKGSDA